MKMNKNLILAGTALASFFVANAALAQSTGSQSIEVVIKGKRPSIGGLGVQTSQAKDQSIVDKDYIAHTVGSSNFAQMISLVPGVNYGNEDPTGVLSSSELRLHGFDGAHISITVDGTPVNDTGNYAVYPGEYAVAESMDHLTVNLGQTEVDSPTASAIGGTVNIITRTPSATPGFEGSVSGGSYGYKRAYVGVETGAIGPTGLRAYLSANYTDANKYKGEGDIKREGFDGRVYQPLDNNGFLSAAFTWASNRPYFYFSASQAQLATYGKNFDYNTVWIPETVTPGVADSVPSTPTIPGSPDYQAGAGTNFWGLHPNPVDFGDIRGQSKFNFGDTATLTVDPYFFYTVANGGGATNVSECDVRLAGTTYLSNGTCGTGKGNGVDLNGDGDVKDTVMLYSPSNTRTHRYGVNSSLIYHFSDTQRLQVSYTLDYGRHRQTGEYGYIDPKTGMPGNFFGAIKGVGGQGYETADGVLFQKRNRYSIAELNQISLNYVGQFMDDKLHVNVGLRNPHFTRKLNEFCYVYNGSTEYCDGFNPTQVAADIAANNLTNVKKDLGITPSVNANGTLNIRAPFKQTYHFNKALPNAGASYAFNDNNSVYVTYAKGFSAPKTDDLYVSSPETVVPETSDQYGAGYRFKVSKFQASVNPWAATWHNHIVQSIDPNDATLSIDRNVGEVKLYGLDIEAGWHPTTGFTLYGSAAFTSAKLQDNYAVSVGGKAAFLPVKGKTLVMTPEETYGLRAQYTVGGVVLGAETKYTGKRFISDMNDASIKANIVTNFDLTYPLTDLGANTVFQMNVDNVFGAKYFPRVSTVSAAQNVTTSVGTYTAGTPFYYVNAPMTAYFTLKTKF